MPPSPGGRFRHALRLIGWNLLLTVVGVALAAIAGEAYFRLTAPFMQSNASLALVLVPNVVYLRPPNTEIRDTNRLDFWTVSRTNSLGFLDREPPNPERAAATCHVSIIGDSFVDAPHVPIEDKLQVRLEELAASRLPHLEITTSAFGIEDTGQVEQLPFYDEYARRLRPKLLVLVFVENDFNDNTPRNLLRVRLGARDRNHRLDPTVVLRPDGKLEWAWLLSQYPPPWSSRPPASWAASAWEQAVERSWLALWLRAKKITLFPPDHPPLLEGWRTTTRRAIQRMFARNELHPLFEDALQYTRFALEQFKRRADRDGAKLVILASHTLKTYRTFFVFEQMSKMAATLAIPVIDQADYILRQGGTLSDAQWPHDRHWNPAGHQWAAEALLEYIEEHPTICDRPTGPDTLLEPTYN